MNKKIVRYSLVLYWGLVAWTSAQASDGQVEDAPLPDSQIRLPAGRLHEPAMLPTPTVLSLDAHKEPNVANSGPPLEIVHERYPSGKVKIRREMTLDQQGNYILHGQWTMWDEAGNVIGTGQYRENQRHGTWTRTHSGSDAELFSEMPFKQFRGPFTSQATFDNGKLHGKWTISDGEQRKISEWEYTNGVLNGLSTWNYASGSLMREATFLDGLIDGYLRQYDQDSKLVIDETYQQGRKLAPKVEYDKAQQKIAEGIYLHARFVIESPDDWWAAKPVKYTAVGEDVKHGCWTSWHPNGHKRVEGIYEQDLPEGEFTWWYPNGQQAVTGNYRKGKPHGAWVWWHENGQKASTGQFTEGEPSGGWVYWDQNGQLQEKSDFSAVVESVVVAPEEAPQIISPQIETARAPRKGTLSR